MEYLSDRRSHRRAPLKAPVEIIYADHKLPPRSCYDISEGGMRLDFLSVPIRSKVQLKLQMPKGTNETRDCLLEGEVVWRKLGSAGVQFLAPPREALYHLRSYVRQYS